jgi:hypothetical protein
VNTVRAPFIMFATVWHVRSSNALMFM